MNRADGKREASINWEDDDGAAAQLFARPEQSGHGAARLALRDLKAAVKIQSIRDHLSWEREPQRKNLYHGNILFGPKSKPNEKEIAAVLASMSSWVRRPPDAPPESGH